MASFTHVSIEVTSRIVAGSESVGTSISVELPFLVKGSDTPLCYTVQASGKVVPATIKFRIADKAVTADGLLDYLRSFGGRITITVPRAMKGRIGATIRTIYTGPKLAELVESLDNWGKEPVPVPAPAPEPEPEPVPAPAPEPEPEPVPAPAPEPEKKGKGKGKNAA